MTDEPIVEQKEPAAAEGSYLIVHHTPDGIHHVHRVRATSLEAAREAVLDKYGDHTVVQTVEDHGESSHTIGGAFHTIHDLDADAEVDEGEVAADADEDTAA